MIQEVYIVSIYKFQFLNDSSIKSFWKWILFSKMKIKSIFNTVNIWISFNFKINVIEWCWKWDYVSDVYVYKTMHHQLIMLFRNSFHKWEIKQRKNRVLVGVGIWHKVNIEHQCSFENHWEHLSVGHLLFYDSIGLCDDARNELLLFVLWFKFQ